MTELTGSFASTPDVRDAIERRAQGLVGLDLVRVRYVDIDYRRREAAPEAVGVREIVDESEWREPTWRFDGFDSVDHGVELETTDHRYFVATWDSPGWTEGISINECRLIGTAVVDEADVAVWDVTFRSGWAPYIGKRIEAIKLHYALWNYDYPSGWWCPMMTIRFATGQVSLLLGEARPPLWTLLPSGDNVAVVFSPHNMPDWAAPPAQNLGRPSGW